MSTPPPSDPTPYRHVAHLAVLHPVLPELLICRDAAGVGLPRVELRTAYFTDVAELPALVRERLGLEAAVLMPLRSWADETARRLDTLYLLEAADAGARVGEWGGRAVLEALPSADARLVGAVLTALRQAEDPALVPVARPPWARRGWWREAERWARGRLVALEIEPSASLAPVKVWSLSVVASLATDRGRPVYLKAVPPLFAAEPEITRVLAERFPGRVPTVLAASAERATLLLDAFGGDDVGDDPEARHAVARRYAAMQLDATLHLEALSGAGAADRREAVFRVQIPRLLASAGERALLEPHERDRLPGLAPWLLAKLDKLMTFAIPETLVHGDMHFGNVVLAEAGPLFYDWTDAAVAHPFFDLYTLLGFGCDVRDPRHAGLKRAYLEPWQKHEPLPRLAEALDLALVLAHAYHAVSYAQIREAQEESARWELEGATAALLRALLTLHEGEKTRS